MSSQYRTIIKPGVDEIVIKRSRFIGSVHPVSTAKEALAFIEEKKKAYWDATHNVFAYRIRATGEMRCSDDGEPQGTAGVPTLDVLQKEDVTDCVVVVTRYYGGIMLGAGGLVRAYSQGAKIALESGGIVTMRSCVLAKLNCDYSFYGKAEALLMNEGAVLVDTQFTQEVLVDFYLPEEKFPMLQAQLKEVSSGQYQAKEYNIIYKPIQ